MCCALYGLKSAAARLADAIGRGGESARLAADWHMSTRTLRSPLKSVFTKIGVHRQVAQVPLLAGVRWKIAAARGTNGAPG